MAFFIKDKKACQRDWSFCVPAQSCIQQIFNVYFTPCSLSGNGTERASAIDSISHSFPCSQCLIIHNAPSMQLLPRSSMITQWHIHGTASFLLVLLANFEQINIYIDWMHPYFQDPRLILTFFSHEKFELIFQETEDYHR